MQSMHQPDPAVQSSVNAAAQWDRIFGDVSEALAEGRPEEELRPKIQLWCEEAKRRNLPPEKFLVVIKSQVLRVPGMRRMARDARARETTLQRIVTMCIEEYFRPL